MKFQIEHKQVETQDNSYAQAQLADVAPSCPINARPNIPVPFASRKCVTPMTFSQKLYQSYAQKKIEEFDQEIEATSLEKIKKLLDKLFE